MPPETTTTEATPPVATIEAKAKKPAAPAPAKKKTVAKAKKPAAPAPAKKARRSKECQAHEIGYHACNCGGNYCGSNVTS